MSLQHALILTKLIVPVSLLLHLLATSTKGCTSRVSSNTEHFISSMSKGKTSSSKKHIFYFHFEIETFKIYVDWFNPATMIVQ